MTKNLFLLGFMGCGKSTIGALLAQHLGWQHIDTDAILVDNVNMDVFSIFEEFGEDKFRAMEMELLLDIVDSEFVVVSSGGGLPCNDYAIRLINEFSTSIYLYMTINELASRLWAKESLLSRPLLKSLKTKGHLTEFIKEKLTYRERYYYDSQVIIDSNQSYDYVVEDIIQFLQLSS